VARSKDGKTTPAGCQKFAGLKNAKRHLW
jgi:hypothetical protein